MKWVIRIGDVSSWLSDLKSIMPPSIFELASLRLGRTFWEDSFFSLNKANDKIY